MPLRAGTKNDYANSMAQAMEKAFLEEWPHIMSNDHPKPVMTDHIRLLFIAISQGVVRHLVNNPDGFEVTFTFGGNTITATVDIEETGTLY